jgi:hypothetical protein
MDQNLAREVVHLSTWQVVKLYFYKKSQDFKKVEDLTIPKPSLPPEGIIINHLAVVIDGRVEEVLRAENRLAALLMSEPQFIQFEPHIVKPTIGWGYDGEKFLIPEEIHDHEH